ncbi:IS21 family transposase [Paraliomyxa miuraensis]|uniref:IS21 family transposase n=1 Tax=Paraliomyxa miuraensis TaxID=376150 RepID=UPI0022598C0A|nr:IS21 family transposase [Paraliomyxa miuraensis]MCX4239077.1 IS21 family transposase [Paraliomyxa miuraensis]
MWEILNVLRRIGRGESKAAVAVATEHTRRTVRRYVQVAEALGWVPGEHEPDEALALEVYRAVRPGVSSDEAGSVEAKLLPHREAITKWLEGEGANDPALRLTKIHRKLEGNGVSVSYPSLRRFVIKHCGFTGRARKLTVRLDEVPPGEVAQVDFGRLGLIEVEPGKRRAVHALVVTLVHSRHQYVHITFEQKLPQLIDGLEDAWEFFGGVTARVIIDNLKAAVTKADRYDPIFQRTFEEYADYRGFVIDAAGVGSPTHKPHVERGVPYVRDSFFKGERWLGIEHLRREVIRWICEVAGQRKHGTTQRKPLEVFEQSERSKLLPLLRPRFDPPTWSTDLKVHTDHCINFDKALYTVPTRHVGKHVDARGDSKLVRIYLKGELIKTHPRKPQGGRSLDHNDYPKEKAGYTMRDPDRMIRQAREHGEHVGSFMERLLEGDYPWAKLRQAHALLRLVSKYGHQRVDAACQRALGFDLVNVKRVERIIKAAPASSNTADDAAPRGQLIQLPLRFQRLAGSFNHQQQSRGQEHEDHRDPTVAQGGDETPTPVGAAADAARQDRLRPQGEAE